VLISHLVQYHDRYYCASILQVGSFLLGYPDLSCSVFSPPSALPSVPVSTNGSKGISSSKTAVITGTILGGLISLFLVAFAVFLLRKRQRSNGISRHFFNRPGHRNRPSESPFIWDRPNESDTDLVHQHLESISGNL